MNSDNSPAVIGQSSLGALWEVAGHWLLALVATVIVAFALLANLENGEREASLDARLRTLLEQAGDRIEVSLSLGIELPAIPEAQDLVERLAASENAIVALDIFDISGVFAASTDRASVRRPAPAEWVAAARAGERTIRTETLRVILVPLEGSFGDTAGYIAAGYSPPRVPNAGYWRLMLALFVVLALALAYAFYEVRRMRRPLTAIAAAMVQKPSNLTLPPAIAAGLTHLARTEQAITSAADSLAAGQR